MEFLLDQPPFLGVFQFDEAFNCSLQLPEGGNGKYHHPHHPHPHYQCLLCWLLFSERYQVSGAVPHALTYLIPVSLQSNPIVQRLLLLVCFPHGDTEAQRGQVTCPQSLRQFLSWASYCLALVFPQPSVFDFCVNTLLVLWQQCSLGGGKEALFCSVN